MYSNTLENNFIFLLWDGQFINQILQLLIDHIYKLIK